MVAMRRVTGVRFALEHDIVRNAADGKLLQLLGPRDDLLLPNPIP